jgi:hypothetical protein
MKQQSHLIIEEIWDNLLSRDTDLITTAFNQLTKSDQIRVIDHLHKMTKDEGWLPVQKASAQAAIECIKKNKEGSEL